MGELKDTAKGLGNQVAGTAKQAVADASDDPALDQEGREQHLKGQAQEVAGKVKGAFGDKV